MPTTPPSPPSPRWSDRLLGRLQSAGVLQHPRPQGADVLVVGGVALSFMLYFVVRGHLNAGLVLLFLLSAVQLARSPEPAWPTGNTGRQARWLVVALAAPFAAVGLTQLAHGEWVPRGFDSALRLAMAGVILLYLVQRRINFLPVAQWVLPLTVLVCAAAVLVYPNAREHYWDEGRYATYFVDPLTLGQHMVILGFLGLFSAGRSGPQSRWLLTLQAAALVLALVVAVGTQSRSSWVIVPVLTILWLVGLCGLRNRLGLGVALTGFALGCVFLYAAVPVVHERIGLAMSDYLQYFDGSNRDTSAGIRLSLWRANWLLFLDKPWTGWGYAHPPVLSQFPPIAPFYTEKLDAYFTFAGGHNEVLMHMMLSGLPGLLSRLLVFGVPLVVFTRAARHGDDRQRTAGYMGLALVLGYLTASINTEVFNLVYIASFYGLLTALLAATALYPPRESHEPH